MVKGTLQSSPRERIQWYYQGKSLSMVGLKRYVLFDTFVARIALWLHPPQNILACLWMSRVILLGRILLLCNQSLLVRLSFQQSLSRRLLFFFSFFLLQKFYIVFYSSYASTCKDLQKTIVLSSGPFRQVFTFTIQCICNLWWNEGSRSEAIP